MADQSLRPVRRNLLYEEVVDRLREFIDVNELKPGDRLMAERDLAEQARREPNLGAPALTTVAMQHQEMGSIAVRLLEQVLTGERAESVVVPTPPRLIERDSVASPSMSGP